MSAECEKCGTDLVGTQWDEGGLSCRPCDLERQLAEAQGKLKRIETEVCTCDVDPVFVCIVHDYQSVLARILKEEK